MEKVPSKGAIQSGKKSVQGTVAVQYGKGAVCLKKSAIDNKKNIIQCRVCRYVHKSAILRGKNATQGRVAVQYGKGAVFF